MAGQNKGYFLPTTQAWDPSQINHMELNSPKFKEFLVNITQQLNRIAEQVNSKGSGLFNTQEFATGETFYPSPSVSSATNTKTTPRPVFRKVINMLTTGTLPNTGTLTVAHGLTFNTSTTLVTLRGAANNAAGTSLIPLPYASPTLANNIELYADGTNIYIVTGSDRTSYTKCNIIVEFLKN